MRRNRLAALDRLSELHSQLGGEPRLELLDSLYRPSVPHECIPEQEDEWWNTVHRIRLEGVAEKRL